LPEIERLSASVIRVLGGNPSKFTLQGTNTYIVGRGPRRLLIDTGEGKPSWINLLENVLSSEKATIEGAILTHWHHDHVSGVPGLLEISPGTKIYKNQPNDGQLGINHGQKFAVEGATLRAYHCPGHTSDHMALVLEEEDAMFTGDNVLGHGTAVFEDLATYLSSLDGMQHQFSGRAYPGHGAVIEDGKGKIAEYIEHRRQRERQIIQVLEQVPDSKEEGPAEWSSMEIVKVVYKDVPENLHLPAESGLLQVLRKLERDGLVGLNPSSNRWWMKPGASL